MKMITVRELDTMRQIPENYIKCSVCLTFHPPESYRNAGQEHRSRTNCVICYNAKFDDWDVIKAQALLLEKKPLPAWEKHCEEMKIISNTISVEEMIAALQSLPSGSRLAVVQSGHYSDGPFASVFTPQKSDRDNYYIIGESHQSC